MGTRYSRLLESLGIKPIFAKPYHPQTKGKLERWFGTVKQMFLIEARFHVKNNPECTLADFNQMLEDWVSWYNTELLVYSIRGQNEGINGILKKRGDIIGGGQHTTWQLGNSNLSKHVSMAQVGIKFMVLVKFTITGQKDHHLRRVHNWRRKKKIFLLCYTSDY